MSVGFCNFPSFWTITINVYGSESKVLISCWSYFTSHYDLNDGHQVSYHYNSRQIAVSFEKKKKMDREEKWETPIKFYGDDHKNERGKSPDTLYEITHISAPGKWKEISHDIKSGGWEGVWQWEEEVTKGEARWDEEEEDSLEKCLDTSSHHYEMH